MTKSLTDPIIGRTIDERYFVREKIARGGMATVYLATDQRLERQVALKIMHGHLADDESFTVRFVQEARSAARLANPHVVNVYDQGTDGELTYIVMEYLPGITLRDLLKEYSHLSVQQTLEIIDPVIRGLAAAHKAGIVHRDLKPENVLLCNDGRIKIGDFGLARAASANTTTGQALLGTIAYLSPELVTRGVADTRSDIYALGIIIYEILTGEQPFRGEQPMQIAYQHANDLVPLPSLKNPSVPAEIDDIVRWSTEKDPEHRPNNAGELLAYLSTVEKTLAKTLHTDETNETKAFTNISRELSNAKTQKISPSATLTELDDSNITTVLPVSDDESIEKVPKRKKKWVTWTLIFLLLLSVGGGGSWYMILGPGSYVSVPTISGKTVQEATDLITAAGFQPTIEHVYSLDVPLDLVIASEPHEGNPLAPGTSVKIIVSQGAKPITVPGLAGTNRDQAKELIENSGGRVGDVTEQFHPEAPASTVLSAHNTSNNTDISGGGDAYESNVISLVISLGPIPDVSGLSLPEANAHLEAVGLKTVRGADVFHDTIAEGNVTSARASSDPIRPGDTLSLEVSKGPEPITVPEVIGETWAVAKEALTAAGFNLDYNSLADIAPSSFVVNNISLEPGTSHPKGTTLTIKFSGF